MSFRRIQDEDAFILTEFVRASKHLLKFSPTHQVCAQFAVIGHPYLARLLANGHDMQACESLMRCALNLPQPARMTA